MKKLIDGLELALLLANSEKLRRLEVSLNNYYSLEENNYFDWILDELLLLLDKYESLEHYIKFNC